MKTKTIFLSAVLFLLCAIIIGCGASGSSQPEPEIDEAASEVRWAAVPAVFVNDTYFRIFADEHHHPIPDLDDSWVLLGTVQSAAPGWESPTENFHTNNEMMIGSEIYFSSGGRIPVTTSTWGDPIDEEVTGDSVIIVFEGSKLWYLSEAVHDEVIRAMEVARHSLMVDGVLYSLMATAGGGDFTIGDNHIFLGEVESAVPMNEYPTENLQSNRESVVGAKVYRLPQGENSDIVVFFSPDSRYYYQHLPGL